MSAFTADRVVEACRRLEDHMKQFSGQLLTPGTYACEQFDKLYRAWIRARWDNKDVWVQSVWTTRP